MTQNERRIFAGQTVEDYMKPLYGFALNRTSNHHDAEDLTQEICARLYTALCAKDDIVSVEKFVWAVARNTLVNYYRGKTRYGIGVDIDDMRDTLCDDGQSPEDEIIAKETVLKLQNEIAYLSKIQRTVLVMFYYDGMKQKDIAEKLDIPVGTVKWHISEAKNELKKGMEKMRNISELKFNPIKFSGCGINGAPGKMGGTGEFFRSSLSQNIAYCVYNEAMTVNEIAENLGVSPVYVESEAQFLEEYGFLIENNGKYIANLLISEPDEKLTELQYKMYKKASTLTALELFDELMKSEILNGDGICYQDNDKNFLMWSLVPYILAYSGQNLFKETIPFEEVATIRPDGGRYIPTAHINEGNIKLNEYQEVMQNFSGPSWNGTGTDILWLIDTKWSEKRIKNVEYHIGIERDLNLLERFSHGETLSKEEYAFMIEKGYIRKSGDGFEFAIVWIKDAETKKKLLEIGDKIKEKYLSDMNAAKQEMLDLALANTPKHLRKMRAFGFQYTFFSDGYYMLSSMLELVKSGKLTPPTDEQKKSVTMLYLPAK